MPAVLLSTVMRCFLATCVGQMMTAKIVCTVFYACNCTEFKVRVCFEEHKLKDTSLVRMLRRVVTPVENQNNALRSAKW
uniref:Secreted protein n=1 Tax=Physcomitrium patens TaxID=3218 RepID=A0A2K1IHL0_PHYPA|nr:hypothetical protein PHYPA_029356 [Physcomitrium patens]